MDQSPGQSAWIALPCILVSLFAARFLIQDFASPNERGLVILAKAALIFGTTLVFTTKIANSLLQPNLPPPTQPRTKNVLHKKQNVSPATTEERVRSWRGNTAPNLRWSSDSSDEVKEEAKQRKKTKKKKKNASKEKTESSDEKSLRKRLSDMFKPKRNEMLGARRTTIEEVVREDPLV